MSKKNTAWTVVALVAMAFVINRILTSAATPIENSRPAVTTNKPVEKPVQPQTKLVNVRLEGVTLHIERPTSPTTTSVSSQP